MNKNNFEPKTCHDSRMWNKHRKKTYQAVTKPKTGKHTLETYTSTNKFLDAIWDH